MRETIIQIDSINPVEIFGVNNCNITLLKKQFPKLKIIVRGNTVKALGDDRQLKDFEEKMKLILEHFNKFNQLTESQIERLLDEGNDKVSHAMDNAGDVLVFGNAGRLIKAKTENQRKMVDCIEKADMLFAVGPAGTGKTYTAVALAVRALKNKEVRKIILTRPAVEAGENLGFLPGDLKEKLDPYLQPLYDGLRHMIPAEKITEYVEAGIIQVAPLAFMRGRTLDNAFVILDEAQNATEGQLKMFLTRMGKSAKFVITGDVTQVDLPKNQKSGLIQAMKILRDVKGIEIVELDGRDVIRHKLIKGILKAYEQIEPKN
ncbi:MAG: PhoH family protein [Flavobacteriales bacterium]|nr:PhoH family protein [Flavobacteriales bacterium]